MTKCCRCWAEIAVQTNTQPPPTPTPHRPCPASSCRGLAAILLYERSIIEQMKYAANTKQIHSSQHSRRDGNLKRGSSLLELSPSSSSSPSSSVSFRSLAREVDSSDDAMGKEAACEITHGNEIRRLARSTAERGQLSGDAEVRCSGLVSGQVTKHSSRCAALDLCLRDKKSWSLCGYVL